MTKPEVILIDYNPDWPRKYEEEKNRILEVTGKEIMAIAHIGSTSIKGLAAKPIIDIMAGIKKLKDFEALIQPLDKIGYQYIPKAEFKERKFFRKGLWGRGTCHLHICEIDSNEWKEKLFFRDFLRLHPESVEEYSTFKKELAAKFQFDRARYTEEKGPFVRAIIDKALMNGPLVEPSNQRESGTKKSYSF
ncbi:GrpB family protein [Mesobacillus zeae]|uniref:GrpB family protein n=1 Tax=Mesobacillus zeae TaxID=1917180 RepID=A0A398BD85_9BACI|nr:GrpB family protein [Mesobacillus zeae]RID85553.1 GrpB family protein [Mesobacillus zeae]